jgi:hypothetical protein
LKQQLFGGASGGRYYLRGSPTSVCFTYAENPEIAFVKDRIVVRMLAHSRLGRAMHGDCVGLAITAPTEVSVVPDAQGETIGYRSARLDRISDQEELNFLLRPFLSLVVPRRMKVNVADLMRKALADSTATSGYKVTLDRLQIRSIQIDGDDLVVDVDGGLGVK